MEKNLILILLILIMPFTGRCQYPILTIYKGDSVVIIKQEQSRQINRKLDEQDRKISDQDTKIQLLTKEKKNLTTEKSEKDSMVSTILDSLMRLNIRYNHDVDSFSAYEKQIEDWTVKAATDKSMIYLDRTTRTIKVINFGNYRYRENKLTHSFKLKPIKHRKPIFGKPIISEKWKSEVTRVREKLFGDISVALGMGKSVNITNYPFHYKIRKDNEKK